MALSCGSPCTPKLLVGRKKCCVWRRLYIQIEIVDGGQMSKQSSSNNHDISKMFSVTGYCCVLCSST